MEEKKNKKIMLSIIGVAILVVGLVGITYAFFNYTRTGASNNIKVGRISFVSKDEETITLSNLFPIDPENTTDMNDTTKVGTYQITIEGDTDYSGGIEYLVSTANSNLSNLPISINMTVGSGLGTNDTNYFTTRDTANTPIYKKIVGSEIVGDQMLLVGFIPQNTNLGTSNETGDTITIKAYLDKNKILISDTYDGTESDNMGTPNSLAQGKTVLTTTEWNALSTSGVSFKIKVEANEGIWVKGSLEEIMKKENIGIDTENGVDFSKTSDEDGLSGEGTKGVYMRAGTEDNPYPIVYYRGAVEDNNVKFANKCWKAVRTTDTGGVKLLYNGEINTIYDEVDLGLSSYGDYTSTGMTFDSNSNEWSASINSGTIKVEFKVATDGVYAIKYTNPNNGPFFIRKGQTSIGNTSGVTTTDAILNLGYVSSSDVYSVEYTHYDTSVTGLVKFSLVGQTNPREGGCDNSSENSHITVSNSNLFAFNSTNNSPAYNGYMYGTGYPYSTSDWISDARFGSSFTWDGTNYTLVEDSVTVPNATHHYSCNVTTTSGTCTQLRYVYYLSGSTKYYITLTSGDGVEQALAKMQTNTNDSIAKAKIDTWYLDNMTAYTNKLEDAIYCNDRSMNNTNGWNENGGELSEIIYYGPYNRATNTYSPSISCSNKNDSFTWKNEKGNKKLNYPVGLLTSDEVMLAGGKIDATNKTYYLYTSSTWWTISPYGYTNQYLTNIYNFAVSEYGSLYSQSTANYNGLRPSISLKPGMPVISGDGTSTSPYVIE